MLFINHIGVKIYEKQQILLCPNCWSCKFKNFSFYRIKFCPRWEILVYFSNPNFLVISSYYWNQSTNWQCFQQFWLHWLCFGFVSFVFMLDIYFSLKKLVLTKTNAIFPEKICCNFSYKIYSKVQELCMHLDYEYLYILNKASYSFKPTFFLGITTLSLLNLLLCGSRFLKAPSIFLVWDFVTTGQEIERNLFWH